MSTINAPAPEPAPEPTPPLSAPTKLVLKKPIEVDGKTLESLNLDVESIPPLQFFRLRREFKKRYGASDSRENIGFDERFQRMLLAHLNGVTPEGIESSGMAISDYSAAEMAITAFFLLAGQSRLS